MHPRRSRSVPAPSIWSTPAVPSSSTTWCSAIRPPPTRRSRRWSRTRGWAATPHPDVDVLRGLSLQIAPGETVALVGASGAGKSTTVSLLPRLYDVTSGAVRIDGHDVRDLTLGSLRAPTIGVVSQDPHLFHETIGDNLRYADADATDDELIAAAKAARIHDTIAALPDGYDTIVGERGYRLSGGEKQRLAISRTAAVEEPGDHGARRGHQPSRQRERGADPSGARPRDGAPHGARDRVSPVTIRRRPDHVRRGRPHCRDRHPRRTPRGERPLREPTQCRGAAAPRLSQFSCARAAKSSDRCSRRTRTRSCWGRPAPSSCGFSIRWRDCPSC